MVIQRIRRFAAGVAADHALRPRTALPSWLLVPGVAMLAASLAASVAFPRDHPFVGYVPPVLVLFALAALWPYRRSRRERTDVPDAPAVGVAGP
ncbi:hypothetical protein ACWEH1_07245 [Micromonospora chersina]